MFERKDNAKLYDAICVELGVDNDYGPFDEEILKSIIFLKLDDIKNLKGIEKLVNLEGLEIIGKEDSTNIFEYKEIYHRNRDKEDFNMEKVFMYYYGEYTKNQITEEDLKYIYTLKKLKYLNLARQRALKVLDVGELKKLEIINLTECMYLTTIKNFDKLEILDKDIKNIYLDFAACYRLKEIEGISSLINKINEDNNNTKNNIFFPTIYFNKLDDSFRKKLDNKIKYFNWSELCPGYRSDISDQNMLTAYNLAKEIIDDCCRLDDSKMDKVSSIYRWVCNNITYDYEGLKMNENAPLYEAREKYNKVVRSSYTTLYYKKGVCVGVSGLFNYLCSLIGVIAIPSYCSTKQIDFRRAVLNNHQISKIYLKNSAYYFDPTFDLDAIEFEFFGKNKGEISNTHFLAMGEYSEANGASIQNILRANGYIRNSKGRAKGEFKRNRGFRR